MKTAKEICEDIKQKEYNDLILKIIFNNGVLTSIYYYTTSKINEEYVDLKFNDSYLYNLIEKYKSELEKNGFKVEKITEELYTKQEEQIVEEVKEIGYWLYTREKVIKHKKLVPIKKLVTYYKVSACCGENEDN